MTERWPITIAAEVVEDSEGKWLSSICLTTAVMTDEARIEIAGNHETREAALQAALKQVAVVLS